MTGAGRPWAVLRHSGLGVPGPLGDALERGGHPHVLLRGDRGELPTPTDLPGLAGLVVLGGRMGVHDEAEHPWLAPERTLLAAAVDTGVPVLAVCLGAQQLALARGAEVTRMPAPEAGPGTVALTAAGRRDPVFGPEYGGLGDPALPCLHLHADACTLPEGAVHLAATRGCPVQAYRIGRTAYALQFHVELDAATAERWAPALEGVTLPPAFVARVGAVGRRLFTRFLDVATATTAAAAANGPAPGGTTAAD